MRVALMITCLTDNFHPRVGLAVVRVLRHFGCDVSFPPQQTCCGQPAYNSGFAAEARALAERTLQIFADCEYVVTPSASCAGMVREHYVELLGPAPEVSELAGKTRDFALFLRDVLKLDVAALIRLPAPVTFHFACHARGQYAPEDLCGWLGGQRAIESGQLRVPLRPDLCCGFGGAFSAEFPETSGAMLEDKLAQLTASGATQVVCNEAGCALHMAGGARRRGVPLHTIHLAEVLAESLGLMETAP